MQRIVGKTLSFLALTLLGATVMPACTDEDGIIYIQNNLAPPQNRSNGCLYEPDATGAFISTGLLDTAISDSYVVHLLVGNQMIQRGDATAPRAETNRVHIDGAVVRVTDANGGGISEFTSLTSGLIDAGSANTPGLGIATFAALDAATVRQLGVTWTGASKLVLANIKVFGKTLGGVDVETAEWTYPIQVVYGKYINFNGDDPAIPGLDCLSTDISDTGAIPACSPGQDEVTLCTQCRNSGRPACDGVFQTTPP